MIHSDVSKEDSEDDDDDDNNEDEDSNSDDVDNDEDEKRAVKPPSQSGHRIYTVLSDFKGEQEGDLSVQVKYFLFPVAIKHRQATCQQHAEVYRS